MEQLGVTTDQTASDIVVGRYHYLTTDGSITDTTDFFLVIMVCLVWVKPKQTH